MKKINFYKQYPTLISISLCSSLFFSTTIMTMDNEKKRTGDNLEDPRELKKIKLNENINIEKFVNQYGSASIHNAIFDGNLDYLKHLNRMGYDILHLKGEDGNTPLHYAIEEKRKEIACYLIEQGADICAPNADLESPLFLLLINDESIYGTLLNLIDQKYTLANFEIEKGKNLLRYLLDKRLFQQARRLIKNTQPNFWLKDENGNSSFTTIINCVLDTENKYISCYNLFNVFITHALQKSYDKTIAEINRHRFKNHKDASTIKGLVIFLCMIDQSLKKYLSPILKEYDINKQDETGNTIYTHCYKLYNPLPCIESHLRPYANVNNQDKDGNTVLHLYPDDSGLIHLLVRDGYVDFSLKNNKGTMIIDVIEWGCSRYHDYEQAFGWCKKFLELRSNYPDNLFPLFVDQRMIKYLINKSLNEGDFILLEKIMATRDTLYQNADFGEKCKYLSITSYLTDLLRNVERDYPRSMKKFLDYSISKSPTTNFTDQEKKVLNANLNTIIFFNLLPSKRDQESFMQEEDNKSVFSLYRQQQKSHPWQWDKLVYSLIVRKSPLCKNVLTILHKMSLSKKVFRIYCSLSTLDEDTIDDVQQAMTLRKLLSDLKWNLYNRDLGKSSYRLLLEYLTGLRLLIEPMDSSKMINTDPTKPIKTESRKNMRLAPEIAYHILKYLPYE